jgi:hypothetical protein
MGISNTDQERRHLAQADQHIAGAKIHIARQREVVEELRHPWAFPRKAAARASRAEVLGRNPSRTDVLDAAEPVGKPSGIAVVATCTDFRAPGAGFHVASVHSIALF